MFDLIIIGAGPAGLSAAVSACEAGMEKVLLIERDKELGGILNQCIHNGFGLHLFKEELTGPEFAGRFIEQLKNSRVEVMSDTMVLDINENHDVHVINGNGYQCLHAKSVLLAMGCRERTRGAIATPGSRGAGVYTAGAAQRYLNMDGYCVGKRVVILGSGDIGLIMARRMTLEGAKVLACVEINSYSAGLQRNIKQCLEDFDIPLYLSHTITSIEGNDRIERVRVSAVDSKFNPIEGTEMVFECDTVLLSVGLIPENEISKKAGIVIDPKTRGPLVYENMETSIPGIFCAGNVVQVHDLADNVALEAKKAALAAYDYVTNSPTYVREIEVKNIPNVTYTVPQHIRLPLRNKLVEISFRVNRTFSKCRIEVIDDKDNVIAKFSRDYITPGELQKINILSDVISKVEERISVRVVEVNDD
ncbi:MAG: NAD(P)/FAD-dependent oxidoreductase [Erysipelotrichaceae bacterium]|nr:NAD(P)/FAD-dependent oxidoreductase [Erysipelotrichaceae bacterium]